MSSSRVKRRARPPLRAGAPVAPIRNPQSIIRNPQSAIRNTQASIPSGGSAGRNTSSPALRFSSPDERGLWLAWKSCLPEMHARVLNELLLIPGRTHEGLHLRLADLVGALRPLLLDRVHEIVLFMGLGLTADHDSVYAVAKGLRKLLLAWDRQMQRDRGTEGRRDGGTEGRRDGGTEGQRDTETRGRGELGADC